MTSRILNLDTNHPRGWGELGQTGDACQHGHQATEADLENLKKHYGLEISYHTVNDNKYRIISLLNKEATDTIIHIIGGDGKYYLMDSNDIPNGLIMPFFEDCKRKKINLIIVDPEYPLEWGWEYLMNAEFVERLTKEKKIIKNKIASLVLTSLGRQFYIKNYEKITENFFVKNKNLFKVHTFIKDFKNILEYIKILTDTNIWLMGDCSGATLISVMYDINKYNQLYKGMIFFSPYWKKFWKEKDLEIMNYFLTKVTKPLLVIQHINDPCQGVDPKISKRIVTNIKNPSLTKYVELDGGIDQGCPNFSLGYHGYRGIEHQFIDEVYDFITNNGKI